jgi:hypothetical protein
MATNQFISLEAYFGLAGPSSKHIVHEDNSVTIRFMLAQISCNTRTYKYVELQKDFKNKNPSPHPNKLPMS